jgi:hypothetical protein
LREWPTANAVPVFRIATLQQSEQEFWLNVEHNGEMANLHIRITQEIARRLLALAQTGEGV